MSTTDESVPNPDSQVHLTTVSIKLPTFWTDSPEVWFLQAEAQFAIKRVTASLTKFHHCVAALPQDVATRLIDLIRSPPADPYSTLRARLVHMYTLSDFQRYQALQSLPVLTDQKPSELMDKMLVLLPEDAKPGFFFLGLFMDRLPADIRSHLLTESIADPRKMATRADELWTVRGRVNTVHSIPSQDFEDLSLISRNQRSRSASSRTRASSPGRSTTSSSSAPECWYHRRWGSQANQCRSPCSFSGN
jgi:hypothetical protein